MENKDDSSNNPSGETTKRKVKIIKKKVKKKEGEVQIECYSQVRGIVLFQYAEQSSKKAKGSRSIHALGVHSRTFVHRIKTAIYQSHGINQK